MDKCLPKVRAEDLSPVETFDIITGPCPSRRRGAVGAPVDSRRWSGGRPGFGSAGEWLATWFR
jgi:hypothetical protein